MGILYLVYRQNSEIANLDGKIKQSKYMYIHANMIPVILIIKST